MDKLTEQKFKTINRLLMDDHVLVHLDSNAKGVDLPAHLMKNQAVILKLSKLFRGALTVLEDKVVADLLFDFGYYHCQVPLSAIWGATSDKGKSTIWPESVPASLLSDMMADASGLALVAADKPQKRAEAAPAQSAVATSSARKRPTLPRDKSKRSNHLKRVK